MLHLSANLAKKIMVPSGEEITLCAGVKKDRVRFAIIESAADIYLIKAQTVTELILARLNQPLAFYLEEKTRTLKVGPVLGILSGIPIVIKQNAQIASLYQKIAETAYQAGIVCYFFTPDFIDFEKEMITGFKYRLNSSPSQKWVLQDFPMPDIIYNQTGFIAEELKPLYRRLMLQYLKEKKIIKAINPFLGLRDKLATYNKLRESPAISKYLPETKDCKDYADVLLVLQKYHSAYLKPTASSLGLGVYKITLKKNGYGIEHHTAKSGKMEETYTREHDFAETIQKIIAQEPYLVQQALDLIHYQGRPVDFRVHLFKNGCGEWDILSTNARIGPVSGIVTSREWGGYREPAEDLLPKVFSAVRSKILVQQIAEICREIAQAIDRVHTRPFGELGFDMAVDKDKKIWMIEVNPKPNWNVPLGVNVETLEKNMARHLLAYCRYLTGLGDVKPMLAFPVPGT